MTCLNLLEVFGAKYRVTVDGSSAEGPRDKDPWLQQIPCQGRGVAIYPQGGHALAVEVDRRPSIAAKLMAIDGVKLTKTATSRRPSCST